jgi:hypothetical protein
MFGITPFSGSYLIGNGTDANFSSLGQFADSLAVNGLSGDLTLNLESGTYDEPVVFPPNSSYQVTIQPATSFDTVILTNSNSTSSDNYILLFDNCSNYVITDLIFLSSTTYGNCIVIQNNSNNIMLDSNTFNGVDHPSTSNHYLVMVRKISEQGSPDNITITNNMFYNGGYQIYFTSSSYVSTFSNAIISHNRFTGAYYTLSISRATSPTIEDNHIEGSYNAIALSDVAGNPQINNNYIESGRIGISLSYVDANTSNPHVFNNVIEVSGASWYNSNFSEEAWGINMSQCSDIVTVYNTVLNTSQNLSSIAGAVTGARNTVLNNQFVSTGSGYSLYFATADPALSDYNTIDYNNVYTTQAKLMKSGNTTFFAIDEFLPFTTDFTHNINVNPLLDINHTPTSAWLDNRGLNITGLTVDYDNFTRNVTPDIGAYEYSATAPTSPLSGTISIGVFGTYPTLTSFSDEVTRRGIIGQLIVNLPDEIYNDQLNLNAVPGTSDANPIVFNGMHQPNTVISYSAGSITENYVVSLTNTDNLHFNNIDFISNGTAFTKVVTLQGRLSDIDFLSCSFTAPETTSASGELSLIAGTGYLLANNLSIGASSFSGGTYGVSMSSDISFKSSNLVINNCDFSNLYRAIDITSFNDVNVNSCSINEFRYVGVSMNGCSSINLTNNTITSTLSNSHSGISAYNTTVLIPENDNRNLIQGNRIKLPGYNGLTVSGSYFDIVNNSISVTNSNASAFYLYYECPEMNVYNNIFYAETGLAMDISYLWTQSSTINYDSNCYYTESNSLLKYGSTYSTLEDYRNAFPQWNNNSISLNPHLSDDLHTESPWLNETGTPFATLLNDIDGDSWTAVPDIGADSFTPNPGSTPIISNLIVGTSTSADYSTIQECISDLESRGIGTNITVEIEAGTYSGIINIRDIPSTNSNNGVSFIALTPGSVLFTHTPTDNSDNYILNLIAAHRISFHSINFSFTSYSYGNLVTASGLNDYVMFIDCQFTSAATSPTTSGISFYNALINNLTVSDCSFQNLATGVSIPGVYNSSALNTNSIFTFNEFNSLTNGISLSKCSDVDISQNSFNLNANAISLNYSQYPITINRNKIYAADFSSAYSGYTQIYLSNTFGTQIEPISIYENIVHTENIYCQALTALTLSYTDWAKVEQNTFNLSYDAVISGGAALYLQNSNYISYVNNIFSNTGNGYAIQTSNSTTGNISNNCFYSEGADFARIDSITYPTFAYFTLSPYCGSASVYAPPLCDDNGYAQSAYLRGRGALLGDGFDIDGFAWYSPRNIGASRSPYPSALSPVTGVKSVGTSGDYQSITEAIYDVTRRGITGDVIITLDAGTYNEQPYISYIPSSDSNAGLTLTSNDVDNTIVAFDSGSENYLLKLNHTSNIEISNLTFQPLDTYYARGIVIDKRATTLSILNNRFVYPAATSNSSAIYSYRAPFNTIQINNNYFYQPNAPVDITGTDGNQAEFNTLIITENDIHNSQYSISADFVNHLIIRDNNIDIVTQRAVELEGIGMDLAFTGNSIINCRYYGLYILNTGSLFNGAQIYNNFIETTQNSSYSVKLDATEYVGISFNTFITIGTTNGSYALYADPANSDLSFIDNICYANGGIGAYFGNSASLSDIRSNCYYSVSGNAIYWDGMSLNSTVNLLSSGTHTNSFIADPMFSTLLPELLATSPCVNNGEAYAGVEIDINGNIRDITPDMGCFEVTESLLALDTPQSILISYNNQEGNIHLSWDIVENAVSYKIWTSLTPNVDTSGQAVMMTSSPHAVIPASGSRLFFVIKASSEIVRTHGTSADKAVRK